MGKRKEKPRPIYRRITKIHAKDFSTVLSRDVDLECGHTAYCWASKRTRCFKCERARYGRPA